MTEIRQRLRSHRLVTITGVGGIGKTRVAVQVGRDVCPLYPDGVWLVDLAAVTDPNLLIQAVAVVLKIGGTREDTIELLTEFLKSRTILLIFDNYIWHVSFVNQQTLHRHAFDEITNPNNRFPPKRNWDLFKGFVVPSEWNGAPPKWIRLMHFE